MKHLILMLSALVAVSAGHAQVAVHEKSPETKYAFTLASPRQTAAILYDASDAAVVKRAAELFAADVEAVTGRRPQVTSATGETRPGGNRRDGRRQRPSSAGSPKRGRSTPPRSKAPGSVT